MGLRIAYSTNAYTKWPLDKAIADIRARGFDGVEILADTPHAFPPADGDAIRSALRDFPVSNLNGNTIHGGFLPGLADPRAERRRERIEFTQGVLDLARALGAPGICVSSGETAPGQDLSGARAAFREALRTILRYAERPPAVRVGIEYEPGFIVGDGSSVRKVLHELDHPLLGVNLDLGHAVCAGEDPAEVVRSFRGRIWNLHVEDIRGRIHRHLIPGRGEIPFDPIRRALDQTGYDGFLTLELYPYKDCPGEAGSEGLSFLRAIF